MVLKTGQVTGQTNLKNLVIDILIKFRIIFFAIIVSAFYSVLSSLPSNKLLSFLNSIQPSRYQHDPAIPPSSAPHLPYEPVRWLMMRDEAEAEKSPMKAFNNV